MFLLYAIEDNIEREKKLNCLMTIFANKLTLKIVFVIVLVMISMSSFLKIPSQSTTERIFL
jgi:hypothetical protein